MGLQGHSSIRASASSWPNNTSREASVSEWPGNSQVQLKRLGPGGDGGAESNNHHPIQDSGSDGTEEFEGNAIYARMEILRTTEIEITTSDVSDRMPTGDIEGRGEHSFLW